jgi:hypothetical protein
VAIAESLTGNPYVDQKKITESKIVAGVSAEKAKDWMLTDADDQATEASGIRMQSLELVAMEQGQPIPIDPRDPHMIHLKVLVPEHRRALQALQQMVQEDPTQIPPATLDGLHISMAHAEAHIQALLKSGTPKDQLKELEVFYKQLEQGIVAAGEAAQKSMLDAHAQIDQQRQIAAAQPPPQGPQQTDGEIPGLTVDDQVKLLQTIYSTKGTPADIQQQIEAKAGLSPRMPQAPPPPVTPPPGEPIESDTSPQPAAV